MIKKIKDFYMIYNIPMPPTVNKSYSSSVVASVNHKYGKTIRYASYDLKMYKNKIHAYLMQHKYSFEALFCELDSRLKEKENLISVDRVFCFHPKAIFRKDGFAKRNDVTNRIKALDDALEHLTGIDDKMFFKGSETKTLITGGQSECVHVKLSIIKFIKQEEIMSKLLGDV